MENRCIENYTQRPIPWMGDVSECIGDFTLTHLHLMGRRGPCLCLKISTTEESTTKEKRCFPSRCIHIGKLCNNIDFFVKIFKQKHWQLRRRVLSQLGEILIAHPLRFGRILLVRSRLQLTVIACHDVLASAWQLQHHKNEFFYMLWYLVYFAHCQFLSNFVKDKVFLRD